MPSAASAGSVDTTASNGTARRTLPQPPRASAQSCRKARRSTYICQSSLCVRLAIVRKKSRRSLGAPPRLRRRNEARSVSELQADAGVVLAPSLGVDDGTVADGIDVLVVRLIGQVDRRKGQCQPRL